MPVRISGAVAADTAIANALQPPTRGVAGPGTTAIPSDWLSRCLAGQVVPGCTYHILEGTTLQVTPTVQTRINDAALVASLGLDSAQVAAFKGRINSGTYIGPTDGSGEGPPNSFPRKNGVAWVGFFTSAGTATNIPWSVAQAQAALNDQAPAWWHNFEVSKQGLVSPPGSYFVPMILETSDFAADKISTAVANAEGNWIIGQGEPDGHGYTPAQVVTNWGSLVNHPDIIANPQIKLVSPYPQGDQSAPGSFLRQVEAGIVAAGYRMWDAIAFDRYAPLATIQTIIANYRAVWPTTDLWIPEYSVDSGFGGGGASYATQAAYMKACSEAFDRLPYLTHHACWYSGPASWGPNNFTLRALYDNAAQPTPLAPVWRNCGLYLPI